MTQTQVCSHVLSFCGELFIVGSVEYINNNYTLAVLQRNADEH